VQLRLKRPASSATRWPLDGTQHPWPLRANALDDVQLGPDTVAIFELRAPS
jgi:hypothetical protein